MYCKSTRLSIATRSVGKRTEPDDPRKGEVRDVCVELAGECEDAVESVLEVDVDLPVSPVVTWTELVASGVRSEGLDFVGVVSGPGVIAPLMDCGHIEQ